MANKTNKTDDELDPATRWKIHRTKAVAYIDELRGHMDVEAGRLADEGANWCDVGDLKHLLDVLRQAVATIRQCEPGEVT